MGTDLDQLSDVSEYVEFGIVMPVVKIAFGRVIVDVVQLCNGPPACIVENDASAVHRLDEVVQLTGHSGELLMAQAAFFIEQLPQHCRRVIAIAENHRPPTCEEFGARRNFVASGKRSVPRSSLPDQ